MTAAQFGRTTQARFLLDAHLHGLNISIPFDSMPGYDICVDNGRRMWRVQVKGCTMSNRGQYSVNINRHRGRIPNFDVVAVWLSRDDKWVFLPRSVRHRRMVRLRPNGKFAKKGWEIFR